MQLIGLLGFKLVGDGEQLVRAELPYVDMGYSSAKGGGKTATVNANPASVPIIIIWVTVTFFA